MLKFEELPVIKSENGIIRLLSAPEEMRELGAARFAKFVLNIVSYLHSTWRLSISNKEQDFQTQPECSPRLRWNPLLS